MRTFDMIVIGSGSGLEVSSEGLYLLTNPATAAAGVALLEYAGLPVGLVTTGLILYACGVI